MCVYDVQTSTEGGEFFNSLTGMGVIFFPEPPFQLTFGKYEEPFDCHTTRYTYLLY